MRRKLFRTSCFLVVLLLAGCGSLGSDASSALEASGIVEAKEVRIAAEISGRVESISAHEGDQVAAGDTLFSVEAERLERQADQAEAALRAAMAQEELAQANLTLAESGVETAELSLEMARLQMQAQLASALQSSQREITNSWASNNPSEFELPAWYFSQVDEIQAAQEELESAAAAVSEAEESLAALLEEEGLDELAAAEAELARARAQLIAAERINDWPVTGPESGELRQQVQDSVERSRETLESAQADYESLLDDDKSEDLVQAYAELAVARGRRQAAQSAYFSLLVGENSLTVGLADLQVEQAEVELVRATASLSQAEAQLASAQAGVEQAEAALSALELDLENRTVEAPLSGRVLTQSLNKGEIVQAGMAVMTIGDLSDLRVTVYLPENRYGRVSVGDQARVSVDSFPADEFTAEVVRIADEAEYTPRNVQTEDERQSTVYAVELQLIDAEGQLIPGMPADVRFDE